ncbi:MAG: hypothetical protein CVU05_15880 [Bacteroidetes bacterium HGW-Bacteroidetes-21]|jgi:uncharacterized membrane protein|nr:MAG: hypothetical protein CVU05_15880 [Bacteroidetes bacterium HGW-Bacteroidetes-21]
MNTAHLHLMFTHLPIVGLGIAIMINLYSLFYKTKELIKLTLWVYLIVGVFAVLAYMTGDGAGEIIKTYPGINEELIESHELYGLLFFIGLMIIGGLSLPGLYFSKKKEIWLKKLNLYLIIAALLMSVLAAITGSTGGEIRHPEIEKGEFQK